MARSFTTIFSVAVCFLVLRTYGVQDANPLGPEPRLAFRVAGQRFLSNLTGISNLGKDVFARQSCGQGYGRCDSNGECCPLNSNCCGTACLDLRPAGTDCCTNDYTCPPSWKCCGTTDTTCAPVDGKCCTTDGKYCPSKWDCCGNLGHCYPTDGWHCCTNDGGFCPNEAQCVYCSFDSTRSCCQGPDGAIVPVYNTYTLSAGNGGTSTSIAVSTSVLDTSIPGTTSFEEPETTAAPVTRYYSTTFTYTLTIWTRITYIQSIVDHTITSTSTVLSCLADDRADALPTLSSMASRVQASAASSAAAASPLSTGTNPAATTTVRTKSNVGDRNMACVDWLIVICGLVMLIHR